MNTNDLMKSAAFRAARSFIIGFISYELGTWFTTSSVDGHRITGLLATIQHTWDIGLGVALVAGILAGGWRAVLDPSGIPSLSDPPPDQAAGR